MINTQADERLMEEEKTARVAQWEAWVAETDALAAEILARRGGKPLDVQAVRADREARDAELLDGCRCALRSPGRDA